MDEIQAIKEKVGRLIAEKGLSLNYVSLKLGRNSTYLHKFVKEKSPKRLDEEVRKGLAQLLNVDEQELTDIDLRKSNVVTMPSKNTNNAEIDEKLLLRILSRVEKWEADNSCEFELNDKARLVKLIYMEFQNEKAPEEQQNQQMGKVIDFFSKVIGN